MSIVVTPPFPMAGTGVLAIEAVFSGLLVSLFWSAYPQGFMELGSVLGVVLLGCWLLVSSLSRRVVATKASKLEGRARVALSIGAVLGFAGIFLGLLSGPHLAGVAAYGVVAQFLVLLLGRMAVAI